MYDSFANDDAHQPVFRRRLPHISVLNDLPYRIELR